MNKQHTPLYGCIAADGSRFTLLYKPDQEGNSSRLEGYDSTIFEGCPPDLPIVDFRTCQEDQFWKVVFPRTAPEYGGDLSPYLAACQAAGATITPDKPAQLDRLLNIEQRLYDALAAAKFNYSRLTIGCMVYEYEKRWGLDDLAAYITFANDNGCQDEITFTLLHDVLEGCHDSGCFEPRTFGYAARITG